LFDLPEIHRSYMWLCFLQSDASKLMFAVLTLKEPRCSTTQGNEASLPSATVTFGMGSAKRGARGSSVNTATQHYTINRV